MLPDVEVILQYFGERYFVFCISKGLDDQIGMFQLLWAKYKYDCENKSQG